MLVRKLSGLVCGLLLAASLSGAVQAKPHHAASSTAKTAPVKAKHSAAASVVASTAAVIGVKAASAAEAVRPASASPVTAAPADSAVEPQLDKIFREIEANRLSSALQLTEALLRQYPNYRLANLIKGDLLLARSQAIGSFGALNGAPSEKVADLRAEAIARLKSYKNRPNTELIPRYLLQIPAETRHAIVVDTQKSRLYLYENDPRGTGKPKLAADYYISQGKLGADKVSEGDKKTPIGVYHVTSSLPRQKLADLYGVGAYPINYPNEWDKRQGRSGSGIWLHGTPSDTYARPPKASDGCVVLTNPDLEALSRRFQLGQTPVVIANGIDWLSAEDWNRERADVSKVVEAWRNDWESKDTERYLRHYSARFSANGQNFEQFAAQKRQVNAGKEWIKIRLDNLSILRNPGKEDVLVVSFDQDYRSSNLNNAMKKRQYWQRENGQWKIIYEGAA